jgi:2-polyprenyl-6-hydroxyphenyl methylase/3-demethylubiquinone-9 3-methyltransferase
MPGFSDEVRRGARFEFGKNWAAFLDSISEERIAAAVAALRAGLGVETLEGKTFLDVGSGSGLSSLAAHRLGATVRSFDYDPRSVSCTEELRRRERATDWIVDEASALDETYLAALGAFDVVYSWGVLHHTGEMWRGLGNVAPLVARGGKLWLAIYNDQGGASRRWMVVKRSYNRAPRALKPLFVAAVGAFFEARTSLIQAVRLQNPLARPPAMNERGMSRRHDLVDWVGGWPFEVAKPEEIVAFYRARGFTLEWLRTMGGGKGCNEYVFTRA